MGQSKEVGGKAKKRCWWLHTEQCSLLCVGIFSVYALLWGRVLGYSARRLLCFSYGRTFCCLLIKKSLPERRKKKEKVHLFNITSCLVFISVSYGGTEGLRGPGFCFVLFPRRSVGMVARCEPRFWKHSGVQIGPLHICIIQVLHMNCFFVFFLKQKFISGQELRIQKYACSSFRWCN